jgi:hypothetical protein
MALPAAPLRDDALESACARILAVIVLMRIAKPERQPGIPPYANYDQYARVSSTVA